MRQAVGVLILFLLEESSGARVSLDQNEAAWRAEHAAKVDHFEWLDLPELVVSPPHYPILYVDVVSESAIGRVV